MFFKTLSFLITAFLFLSIASSPIQAHDQGLNFHQGDELDDQLREKRDEIKKVEQQLADAQKQEKTLKTQLEYIDAQNKLTQLKIEETEFQITKLEKEITDLGNRITRISSTLDNLTEVLLNRIVETYKHGNVSTLDMLFSSKSVGQFLQRMKYLEVAQANDKKVLYQLQATKTTYNDQKIDKQTRQTQQEKLKKDLEQYTIQLAQQKKAKEELLRITKNDEEKFQQLLARLRADAESISRALGGRGVKLGLVKKGERIASVGNSGCSTGPHLHMEVMTPASVKERDGKYYIEGKDNKVDPLPYIQSGEYPKPTANYTGHDCSESNNCNIGDITTKFKQWYNVLGGSYHTGLDIADYSGSSIYSASDGTSYAFSDSQSCRLTGTVGKGIAVDHQNGTVTLYWHIP